MCMLAVPALAQVTPMGQGAGGLAGGAPQPQARVPDIAPAGVPGAGAAPVETGPQVSKADDGDPTAELFAAVNSGDYNSAQDAISRGADLFGHNALGETPLDVSIALNRSSITFLILATRNETGGDEAAPGAAWPLAPQAGAPHAHVTPAADTVPVHVRLPVMGNDPGTPDPAAGFLGFGPQS